jgi:hypothetical protein
MAVAEAHIAPGSFAWSVAAGDADAAVWRPGIIGIWGFVKSSYPLVNIQKAIENGHL